MIDLEGFAKRIEKYYNDVRSEVLVAELMQQGWSPNNITIVHAGQHKRSYRRDLDEAYVETHKNNQDHIVFQLNRDSIYDSLPEGLFHQAKNPKNGLSVGNMIESYRKRKEEEREARAFFAPLENEFFLQKAFVELMEKEFLENLNKNNNDEYFLDFFNIPSDLPPSLVAMFTSLLPYGHHIIGNLSLTLEALELILEEKISYKIKDSDLKQVSTSASLAESELGVDFILGNSFYPDDVVIEITIGPLKKENLKNYFKGKLRERFIQTFFSFFLPANLEFETIFEVSEETEFCLGLNNGDSILGYTTSLHITEPQYA